MFSLLVTAVKGGSGARIVHLTSGAAGAYAWGMLNWAQCPLVESDPQRVHGAWVFKDTRLPISIVFECLAMGATAGDIVEWYGGVTEQQVQQVVSFVAESLSEPAGPE